MEQLHRPVKFARYISIERVDQHMRQIQHMHRVLPACGGSPYLISGEPERVSIRCELLWCHAVAQLQLFPLDEKQRILSRQRRQTKWQMHNFFKVLKPRDRHLGFFVAE